MSIAYSFRSLRLMISSLAPHACYIYRTPLKSCLSSLALSCKALASCSLLSSLILSLNPQGSHSYAKAAFISVPSLKGFVIACGEIWIWLHDLPEICLVFHLIFLKYESCRPWDRYSICLLQWQSLTRWHSSWNFTYYSECFFQISKCWGTVWSKVTVCKSALRRKIFASTSHDSKICKKWILMGLGRK